MLFNVENYCCCCFCGTIASARTHVHTFWCCVVSFFFEKNRVSIIYLRFNAYHSRTHVTCTKNFYVKSIGFNWFRMQHTRARTHYCCTDGSYMLLINGLLGAQFRGTKKIDKVQFELIESNNCLNSAVEIVEIVAIYVQHVHKEDRRAFVWSFST